MERVKKLASSLTKGDVVFVSGARATVVTVARLSLSGLLSVEGLSSPIVFDLVHIGLITDGVKRVLSLAAGQPVEIEETAIENLVRPVDEVTLETPVVTDQSPTVPD